MLWPCSILLVVKTIAVIVSMFKVGDYITMEKRQALFFPYFRVCGKKEDINKHVYL